MRVWQAPTSMTSVHWLHPTRSSREHAYQTCQTFSSKKGENSNKRESLGSDIIVARAGESASAVLL